MSTTYTFDTLTDGAPPVQIWVRLENNALAAFVLESVNWSTATSVSTKLDDELVHSDTRSFPGKLPDDNIIHYLKVSPGFVPDGETASVKVRAVRAGQALSCFDTAGNPVGAASGWVTVGAISALKTSIFRLKVMSI